MIIDDDTFRFQSHLRHLARFGLEIDPVRHLVNAYLVRPEQRQGTTVYELTHDRLVRPIVESNRRWRERNLKPCRTRPNAGTAKNAPPYLTCCSKARVESRSRRLQRRPGQRGGTGLPRSPPRRPSSRSSRASSAGLPIPNACCACSWDQP